jgi:tetratricopeptide (TPR) repeat protein
MKVISPRQQKHPPLPQHAEEKLNKLSTTYKLKAVSYVCLFLLTQCQPLSLSAQQWSFDENTRKAYDLILNLQTERALELITEPSNAQEVYLVSLAQAIELLITEDAVRFQEYEDLFQVRLDAKIKSTQPDYQFLMAEMHLQWAFVYLKFGHEFDAGAQLREAFIIAEKCRDKWPKYMAIRKTTGLIEVILGSVPEKYNWLLGLLGMQGSIVRGLADLEAVQNANDSFSFEAELLISLIQGFVFQKPEDALLGLKNILDQRPDNRLALFISSALAIKNSQSEMALAQLSTLDTARNGMPLYYADYLKGEVFLHKAEYLNALSAYRSFINHYNGQNYIKDAYYKMGLCYWLNGNVNDALSLFKEARTQGKEASEADKSAARSLADKQLPNLILSKARFATDGGYYSQARTILVSITDKDLPARRDQVEYYYRKARLEHKSGNADAAKLFYRQTIDMAGDENWYFAPNACLQLGYIFEQERHTGEAENFFRKALTYKKHEYKNSIESKAKSALGRLNKK